MVETAAEETGFVCNVSSQFNLNFSTPPAIQRHPGTGHSGRPANQRGQEGRGLIPLANEFQEGYFLVTFSRGAAGERSGR